jgi:hypothetical protein
MYLLRDNNLEDAEKWRVPTEVVTDLIAMELNYLKRPRGANLTS